MRPEKDARRSWSVADDIDLIADLSAQDDDGLGLPTGSPRVPVVLAPANEQADAQK